MSIKPFALCVVSVLAWLLAAHLIWVAESMLVSLQHMSALYGTIMSDATMWMVSLTYIAAGILILGGLLGFVLVVRVARQKSPRA